MFCPSLHTLEGLSPAQAVEAVLAGYRGQDQVVGGVIIVALRSSSQEHGLQMARLAARSQYSAPQSTSQIVIYCVSYNYRRPLCHKDTLKDTQRPREWVILCLEVMSLCHKLGPSEMSNERTVS